MVTRSDSQLLVFQDFFCCFIFFDGKFRPFGISDNNTYLDTEISIISLHFESFRWVRWLTWGLDFNSRAFDSSRCWTWREDEHLLFDSATRGIYKFQLARRWCESEKMSCNAILKKLYEPKMDVTLTIRFKITAEIEITKHMFCVLLCRRGRVSAFWKA